MTILEILCTEQIVIQTEDLHVRNNILTKIPQNGAAHIDRELAIIFSYNMKTTGVRDLLLKYQPGRE